MSDVSKSSMSPQSYLAEDERGLSMLEAALVLPIVIGLFFAVVQYGLIFGSFITLRNGAALAVRTLAISGNGFSDDVVKDIVKAGNPFIAKNNITVTHNEHKTVSVGGFADTSQVSLDLKMPLFFPIVVPQADADGTITLSVEIYARAN